MCNCLSRRMATTTRRLDSKATSKITANHRGVRSCLLTIEATVELTVRVAPPVVWVIGNSICVKGFMTPEVLCITLLFPGMDVDMATPEDIDGVKLLDSGGDLDVKADARE